MIRMDSLVVVTRFEMNAVACMRTYIPFVQVLNFRIHFHASTVCKYSLQFANYRRDSS